MRAVDTNVLVRALVRDDAAQAAKAEEILARDDAWPRAGISPTRCTMH
jgi:predicted nucleic-acid-binding protein